MKPTLIFPMINVFAAFLAAFLISAPAFAQPSIVNINVETDGSLVLMNADLIDGLTDSIQEAIDSGIPVTFTYRIELMKMNSLWMDKPISYNEVSNTVHYDSLEKVYRFSSIGRNVQRKIMTRNKARYQTLISTLKDIPIASIKKLDADQKYYLRVKADVETDRLWFPFNYIFFFVPFNDIKTSWAQSSPLVWKPQVYQASTPRNHKRVSKKRSGKPTVLSKDAIRTFNE